MTNIPTSTASSQAEAGTGQLQEFELLADPPGQPPGGPPVAHAEKKAKPAHAAAPAARLLVADESPAVRSLLTRVLEAEGFEVVLASSGQEATERFAQGGIDLVLLDLGMEVRRGWSTFEELVALKEDQAIILMTGTLGEVDVRTTGHLAHVVEKPLNVSTLLATIRRTLSDPLASRRSTLASQQDLARYAKPYVPQHFAVETYEHWGLND